MIFVRKLYVLLCSICVWAEIRVASSFVSLYS